MIRRVASVGIFAGLLGLAYQQSLMERFKQRSIESEKAGLAEPFKGITSNGSVEAGLFRMGATGVSTEPSRKAAATFLSALDAGQRAKSTFAVDDPEWRKWMNQHFYVRQGVSFLEMSEGQRDAAYGMMGPAMSPRGLQLARDIMKLNTTLAELNNNDFEQYGEGRYHVTLMGSPSKREPWGWQIDGHHLIVNYFVLGDQVVMTPLFVGSEPVIARTGKYAGTRILQAEQAKGLEMIRSLDESQRAKAVVMKTKTANNNVGEAFKDNVVLDYAGIAGADLNAKQKEQLLALAGEYVANMDAGHAKVKVEEIKRHLDRTYFAWIGGTGDDTVFYYRIHSPVILIEFDHQLPVGIRHLATDPKSPNREHVHIVVRTPNGNDYGKDFLRQHYARASHGN